MQTGSKGKEIIFGFNGLKRSFCGLGADDKNGIWICLKCLEEFDVMKCVFFVGEETGCYGSSHADMSFFNDCRFVLQCDRKGNSDMVTYYCGNTLCSDDFLLDTTPDKFGYRQSDGMITDVITLKNRGLKVSCANLSCGYYHPHSPYEFTCWEDLMKCYRFVGHIIENCSKTYPHQIIENSEIQRDEWANIRYQTRFSDVFYEISNFTHVPRRRECINY
jgi:putative aminopeptidase FrvX